jgi:hypothetical protein
MNSEKSDLIEVIDNAALIENYLDQIITEFYRPAPERFFSFQWILLNSSVMSLGAKIKVVLAIAHEVDFDINIQPVQEVIRVRNAFAHHSTNAHPVFVVEKKSDEFSQYQELHLINASGKLKKLRRSEAFSAFKNAFEKSSLGLVDLIKFLKSK